MTVEFYKGLEKAYNSLEEHATPGGKVIRAKLPEDGGSVLFLPVDKESTIALGKHPTLGGKPFYELNIFDGSKHTHTMVSFRDTGEKVFAGVENEKLQPIPFHLDELLDKSLDYVNRTMANKGIK